MKASIVYDVTNNFYNFFNIISIYHYCCLFATKYDIVEKTKIETCTQMKNI